ncbi:MAG: lipoic acid synthetase [Candidatus Kentron sp. G]|nr:MAG: lipoic acid synthetase [Candidatus Kentron sp. G]VFM95902.1 MAG: lipoic acid synthetase [Candidatus Kentron sp. G]VFM97607.1 MAG: lipoic acid synthetase [Candidatus Kentron sp. G]
MNKGSDRQSSLQMRQEHPLPRKPAWIRVKAPMAAPVLYLKNLLRTHRLHTVCEAALCPNLAECFGQGTATFLIMGDVCTRRCPFCDVAHGRPEPLDPTEPQRLAQVAAEVGLDYVVITSVDRDDLRDGGGGHFAACIRSIREGAPDTRVEILVPDFRGRLDKALAELASAPPDVFNHNLETVPRLYRTVRPGADYHWSLQLLARFHAEHPDIPTKSGLMLGLGEQPEEVLAVLQDLRDHGCERLTIGQYLQPTRDHLPVARFASPVEFEELAALAREMGFAQIASGPLVRSSYHAKRQAMGEQVK